jgi:glycosyltransferase involved in cell wall biosynthesis
MGTFEVKPAPTGEAKTLIYAGNLAAYQGIDLMLRAFAALRGKRKDVRLEIVAESGFAPYEPLALELGVRESIDLVPVAFAEVPLRLAGAAVALNPRTSCDGIPQKLLNYMAAGRPIVSFAGSAKHLRHGELGLVVANDDVTGFAEAIDHLLDDTMLARALGENARAHVRAERSWEGAAEQIEAVFDRVCK